MLSRRARRFTTCTLTAVCAVGLLSVAPAPAAFADRQVAPGPRPGPQPVPVRRRPAPGTPSQLVPVVSPAPTATPAQFSPQAERFLGQKPSWHGCIDRTAEPGLPAGYYRLQCATIAVPLDWDDPSGSDQLQIAVSRLPASTSPPKGVLFTNPGGPGAAGVDLPLLFVSDARKQLTRHQDIYGMDVRGTGDSTNLSCGGAPSLLLDPRDRDATNLDLLLDGADRTARACAVASAGLLGNVTTDQTVRDFDLLRRLIGAPTVNWLGYSAGTWLGAQYATAFPSAVGHMVLDSNVDFTGTWQAAFQSQPAAFERRFRTGFLPWVAKYQAVYGLGDTADAVEASYERIRAGLQPSVPVDSAAALDQLLAGSLYSKELFPPAASVLADLNTFLAAQHSGQNSEQSSSTTRVLHATRARLDVALPMLRRVTRGAQPFAGDATDAAFLAVTCNDTPWVGDRAALITRSQQLGEVSPLIGWATISQPCAFWHRPAISTPVPDGAGVPPVLMVQSQDDPATPIEGAQRDAAAFAGARLLTVTGEGDHGLYAGGNTCVNKAVENFILAGALPAAGATCAGRPLPDPTISAMSAAMSPTPARSSATARSSIPAKGTNPLVALRQLAALTR
jgi:pimeloyl-ACP methyl ester carboxylesterase